MRIARSALGGWTCSIGLEVSRLRQKFASRAGDEEFQQIMGAASAPLVSPWPNLIRCWREALNERFAPRSNPEAG